MISVRWAGYRETRGRTDCVGDFINTDNTDCREKFTTWPKTVRRFIEGQLSYVRRTRRTRQVGIRLTHQTLQA